MAHRSLVAMVAIIVVLLVFGGVCLIWGSRHWTLLTHVDDGVDYLVEVHQGVVALPDQGDCKQRIQTTLVPSGVNFYSEQLKLDGSTCVDTCLDPLASRVCRQGECTGSCVGVCASLPFAFFPPDCPTVTLSDWAIIGIFFSFNMIPVSTCSQGICRYHLLFDTLNFGGPTPLQFVNFRFAQRVDWRHHGNRLVDSHEEHCMGFIADTDPRKHCLKASLLSLLVTPFAPDVAVCTYEYHCAKSWYDGSTSILSASTSSTSLSAKEAATLKKAAAQVNANLASGGSAVAAPQDGEMEILEKAAQKLESWKSSPPHDQPIITKESAPRSFNAAAKIVALRP